MFSGKGFQVVTAAGTNGRRWVRGMGTGERVASAANALRTDGADTVDGTTVEGADGALERAEAPFCTGTGKSTCALATLAVAANSARAMNLNFILGAFGSPRRSTVAFHNNAGVGALVPEPRPAAETRNLKAAKSNDDVEPALGFCVHPMLPIGAIGSDRPGYEAGGKETSRPFAGQEEHQQEE